jgi:dolichyl-phosphate beta-glucosyltransferase
MKPFLSLVIPAYNEAKRIEATLKNFAGFLKSQNYDYEIIVVDDGSVDGTGNVVKKLNVNKLQLISNGKNLGKGAAVKKGMLNAIGEVRIFTDADMPVAPENFNKFILELKNHCDVAIASIDTLSGNMVGNSPWYRRILGRFSRRFIKFMIGWDIKDSQRGFKAFLGPVANEVFKKQTINGWGFDIEVLTIAKALGYKIKEIPVLCVNGEGSRVRLFSYFKTLAELLKIKKNNILRKYN